MVLKHNLREQVALYYLLIYLLKQHKQIGRFGINLITIKFFIEHLRYKLNSKQSYTNEMFDLEFRLLLILKIIWKTEEMQ